MEPIFYVNGKFLPKSQAFIHVSDLGLLRGYGVFDYTMTHKREPFRLKDHLERLQNSAKIIDLDFHWSRQELTELVYEILEKNHGGEKGIRILITGGESPDTMTPSDKPSIVVIVSPDEVYPVDYYNKGVKVITFPAKREIPQAKTLNYVHAIRALKRARRESALESLYTHDGVVSECTMCSFFAVKDGSIITAGRDVLDGITRRIVLELVKDRMPVDYRFVKVSEIPTLDEAFLAASGEDVMPIVTIDQTMIGDGKPGPITRQVMKLFAEYKESKS
jgi:branched-chain amino acid aminotransferase